MIVAIIPARGGSKRIPEKNIRPFAGRPIMAYSIQAAQETGLFDQILVSTDSERIAEVALACGAEVPFFRPADLADDFTGTAPVLLHALDWLQDRGGAVEAFCCIYPAAPLIKAHYICEGYRLLKEKRAATAFSVTTFPYPIFRALRITEKGNLEMIWREYEERRSNDLPETYHDAGQFYWGDAQRFREEKRLFSCDSVPVVLPRYLVQDIDTLEDWDVAERLYRASHMPSPSQTD